VVRPIRYAPLASVVLFPAYELLQIDVVVAAQHSGQDRGDLARKISDWELSGMESFFFDIFSN